MNPRERMLAIAVGAMMVAIFGVLGYSYIAGQFSSRRAEVTRLETDVQKFGKQDQAGKRALLKIAEFEARSLPANVEVTRSQYQHWLLSEVQLAGMTKPDVSYKNGVKEGDIGEKLNFSATAKGTLPQVIDFLHAFYSVDWLHRITRLSLQPIKDEKALNMTIDVEALSLKKAADTEELVNRPSQRLKLADRKAYHDAVAHRNLYGPPNNAPRISGVSGSKDVYLGRSAELTVKGSDADPLDKLRYKLVQSPDSSAELDEQSGRLSWKPKEMGKYEFLVEAHDDGLPPRVSNRETIVVNVSKQPDVVARLDFDEAKYTTLSAVIDLDGKGEIWLRNRPAGKTIVLHEGDQFEIGSIKGTVIQIGLDDFTFRCEDKIRSLANGGILEAAPVLAQQPAAAASEPAKAAQDATPTSASGPSLPAAKDRAG